MVALDPFLYDIHGYLRSYAVFVHTVLLQIGYEFIIICKNHSIADGEIKNNVTGLIVVIEYFVLQRYIYHSPLTMRRVFPCIN